MATAYTEYVRTPDFERNNAVMKERFWHPVVNYQSNKPEHQYFRRTVCFVDAIDQVYWNGLMQKAHLGCKVSYRSLLEEIDAWLDDYLVELGFAGNHNAVILEILQAVHDKIATCDPKVGVASWLTSVVDYKLTSASRQNPRAFGRIETFLSKNKRQTQKEKFS